MGAHSKTAKEMLYLEIGVMPLRFIIMSRRMSYLHHILSRNKNEQIYKFYKAQERNPIKDDWVLTANSDRNTLNISNERILNLKKKKFKAIGRK